MGFFDKAKETIRDHTRDNIYTALRSIGIDAQMAEHGFREEKIGADWGKTLGVIDIPEGYIRWVNVIRFDPQPAGPGGGRISYRTDYAVLDTRLRPSLPELRFASVRIRNFPLIGNVVDLRWRGDDYGLGIIERLNKDILLKNPIMESRDVEIRAFHGHNCWIISTRTGEPPSATLWNCYQAIARHLLAEWKSAD